MCVFSRKIFFTPKIGKMGQKWTKNRAFWIFWWTLVLAINFYWIFSLMKICYLLWSCTNPIFVKLFVPEKGAKMYSTSQILECFNQPYLLNKLMELSDFVHVDINSHKFKVDQKPFERAWSKIGWPVLSWGSKIECISGMNRWNELISCMLVHI